MSKKGNRQTLIDELKVFEHGFRERYSKSRLTNEGEVGNRMLVLANNLVRVQHSLMQNKRLNAFSVEDIERMIEHEEYPTFTKRLLRRVVDELKTTEETK